VENYFLEVQVSLGIGRKFRTNKTILNLGKFGGRKEVKFQFWLGKRLRDRVTKRLGWKLGFR